MKRTYISRGFRSVCLLGDNEFNISLLKQKILPSDMKICAKYEHVHLIERSIRTVKKRCRCTTHSVPYTCFPIIMTKSLVQGRVRWLNSFSPTNGISDTISPATIVLGKPKPDSSKPKICFGAYALAYTKTKKDMKTRDFRPLHFKNRMDKEVFISCLFTRRKRYTIFTVNRYR